MFTYTKWEQHQRTLEIVVSVKEDFDTTHPLWSLAPHKCQVITNHSIAMEIQHVQQKSPDPSRLCWFEWDVSPVGSGIWTLDAPVSLSHTVWRGEEALLKEVWHGWWLRDILALLCFQLTLSLSLCFMPRVKGLIMSQPPAPRPCLLPCLLAIKDSYPSEP